MMRGGKSGFFHRSACEYIQEWMRMVSEYTEEDANGFGGGRWAIAGLTPSGPAKDLPGQIGQMVRLDVGTN